MKKTADEEKAVIFYVREYRHFRASVSDTVLFILLFVLPTAALFALFYSPLTRGICLWAGSIVSQLTGEAVDIMSQSFLPGRGGVFYLSLEGSLPTFTHAVITGMDSVVSLAGALGVSFSYISFPFAMPIGISFFTFQALSYVIDVSRGDAAPQKSYFRLLLYISMFPQLIAGPIVRYTDVEREILTRRETGRAFADGAFRFCVGLGKKVILANYAGSLATTLLTDNLASLSAGGAWVGMLMYTFQIYFDFSGYSDMAIGLGWIFGFRFKENFNYPYTARTVTEFWRRWHISLSSFFRDYVYIPLGGNRRRQYLNIIIVWALTGLWHGASWNFMIWGLYYAALLVAEKLLKKNGVDMGAIPVASNILLILIVMFGWAIFYYTDASQLLIFCKSLIGLGGVSVSLSLKEASAVNELFFLIPVMALAATPLPARLGNRIFAGRRMEGLVKTIWAAALFAVSFVMIMNQTYNPFLYFRF